MRALPRTHPHAHNVQTSARRTFHVCGMHLCICGRYERVRLLGYGTYSRAVLLRSRRTGDLVVSKEVRTEAPPAQRPSPP